MSVQIEINIANGTANRYLKITNIGNIELDDGGRRSLDQICDYYVESRAQVFGSVKDATFEHRYGDDVTVLIAKAGDALRDKYGRV